MHHRFDSEFFKQVHTNIMTDLWFCIRDFMTTFPAEITGKTIVQSYAFVSNQSSDVP